MRKKINKCVMNLKKESGGGGGGSREVGNINMQSESLKRSRKRGGGGGGLRDKYEERGGRFEKQNNMKINLGAIATNIREGGCMGSEK